MSLGIREIPTTTIHLGTNTRAHLEQIPEKYSRYVHLNLNIRSETRDVVKQQNFQTSYLTITRDTFLPRHVRYVAFRDFSAKEKENVREMPRPLRFNNAIFTGGPYRVRDYCSMNTPGGLVFVVGHGFHCHRRVECCGQRETQTYFRFLYTGARARWVHFIRG